MADFVDNFPDADLLDMLGDSISHVTKSGVITQVKAVLELDVQIDEYSADKRNEIELLNSDFNNPIQRGEQIIHNGTTYILDSLLSRDEHYQRWGLIDG